MSGSHDIADELLKETLTLVPITMSGSHDTADELLKETLTLVHNNNVW